MPAVFLLYWFIQFVPLRFLFKLIRGDFLLLKPNSSRFFPFIDCLTGISGRVLSSSKKAEFMIFIIFLDELENE